MMPFLHLLAAGSCGQGQLGIGVETDASRFVPCRFVDEEGNDRDLPLGVDVLDLSAGATHTLLLLSVPARSDNAIRRNEVWASGLAYLGPPVSRTLSFKRLRLDIAPGFDVNDSYEPALICVSWETTLIVLRGEGKDDVVISMGAKDYGKLGVEGATVSGPHVISMETTLPSSTRRSNTLRVVQLAAGISHIVAILRFESSAGEELTRIVGWGAARHGQLGPAFPTNGSSFPGCQATPAVIEIIPGTSGNDDAPAQIALGQRHTVVRFGERNLIGCGSSRMDAFNGIERLHGVKLVGCTWSGTYALLRLREGSGLWSVGRNDHGQLGRSPSALDLGVTAALGEVPLPAGLHVVEMACGSEHVVVLCRSDYHDGTEVWGWGWNEHGTLGIGHNEDVRGPARLWPSEVCVHSDAATEGRLTPAPHLQAMRVWAGCGTTWILCSSA